MTGLHSDLTTTSAPPTINRGDGSEELTARGGYSFLVRPAVPSDEAGLAEFFEHVGEDDLRFRFLTAVQKVRHDQLKALVTVDHRQTENFLAIEPGTDVIIATAMMAADPEMRNAEVAMAIRADFKHRGVSWTLLDHVARFAASLGIRTLESVESRDNHQAIALEHEMGWTASSSPGDGAVVTLRKTLPAVAA